MKPGILLVRADATIISGTGHVMRCLALAQAWQHSGGKVVFAMQRSTPAVLERLKSEDIQVVHLQADDNLQPDAAQVISLAREQAASWVVVDGYQFDWEYQAALACDGLKVLLVDDLGREGHYMADLVLNQNAHAQELSYRDREHHTRLLLGPRYAMLRSQFASWGGWLRAIPAEGRRVLVTMGGSDPDNFTLTVLEALQVVDVEDLEVQVAAGGSNPHLQALESAVGQARHPTRLVTNAENMPELMAWADVAISAAGTTCWEMCCLGLPSLTVDLAANQLPVAQRLDQVGVTRHIGSSRNCPTEKVARDLMWLLTAEEVRCQMSRRGRELVDGKGASRVCSAMMDIAMMDSGVRVRRARESDCRLLWEWANEPGVRASSFSQRQIGWEEHVHWFQARLADTKCVILIGEDARGRPLGQIRFDQQAGGVADIDVSIARGFRRAGYGSVLIDSAIREVFGSTVITKVNAFIRPENLASVRAFEKAGFRRVGESIVKGNRALHLCRQAAVHGETTVSEGANGG